MKRQIKGIGDLPHSPYKWEDIQHGNTNNSIHYNSNNNWGVFKRSGVQMSDIMCKNVPRGQHITVRCRGCGSKHSTKNIGDINEETKVVIPHRSIFDILGDVCTCADPTEHPLIHDCSIDDKATQ